MTRHVALATVAIALIAGGAHAQSRPKPEDPAAPTAPLSYVSPFEGYRAFTDEPNGSWRALNDEVGRVGGHVGVLRAEEQGATQRPAGSAAGASKARAATPGTPEDKQKK